MTTLSPALARIDVPASSAAIPDPVATAAVPLSSEARRRSRFDNPTVSMLERRLASLESGTAAVATGSGMAALDAGTSIPLERGRTSRANIVVSSRTRPATSAMSTRFDTKSAAQQAVWDVLSKENLKEMPVLRELE